MILNVVGYTISYQIETFFVPNVNRRTTHVRGYVQERTEREKHMDQKQCRGARLLERNDHR